MLVSRIVAVLASGLVSGAVATGTYDRKPLTYAPIPEDAYVAVPKESSTTLLDLVSSRPELSVLTSMLETVGGLSQAFATDVTWKYTFFAPSNKAFEENTGEYWDTFLATPKGKWWLGNTMLHHYLPNTVLDSASVFEDHKNHTNLRIQTGNYLFVGSTIKDGSWMLNNMSTVTEADIPVTNGVVHIIDHILDPSTQIFNSDLPKAKQNFIAGSCSNRALPYC